MERLKERLAIARQALGTLREILDEKKTHIVRDATIQRFEYTYEAVWKAAQLFLRIQEGMETGSPKSSIRDSLQVGLLTDQQAQTALRMADDRNLTVHTYNEALAEAIYSRVAPYADLMEVGIQRMEGRLS